MRSLSMLFALWLFPAALMAADEPANSPGLLFYLSGDHGFRADYAAGGKPEPNFLKDVKILPGGAKGSYLQCGNDQLLSYWAPGNIYSQRGTLSFYWRSRDPVDATEFPVFRVGYGDHSSWDMVWLRIDYNGHGFDAFVTDVNLGRTRVSYTMPNFPKGNEWVHLALAWDETTGIRFYVNGKLAGEKAATGMFDAALDQFGPHSRIIGPTGVESSYNYDRGGDIDELRIYDRMLSDDNIASLAQERDAAIDSTDSAPRPPDWQKDWWFRYGWNRAGDIPAPLPDAHTIVRKVEIHDAYDLKRWWWKGTDGIRETTWPGVYNRSRLVGRFDYFQLPDWDCYSLSGKSVTFYMPNEPWNHLEIQGGAWGNCFAADSRRRSKPARSPILISTILRLCWRRRSSRGRKARSAPLISSISRSPAKRFASPTWSKSGPSANSPPTTFIRATSPPASPFCATTSRSQGAQDNPSLAPLVDYIHGRFPAEQRATMVATPGVRCWEERWSEPSVSAHRAHPHSRGLSRIADGDQPRPGL